MPKRNDKLHQSFLSNLIDFSLIIKLLSFQVKETPIFNECTFMLDTKIHLLQNEFGGDLSKLKFVSYPIEEN